jgi:hypothetical protein
MDKKLKEAIATLAKNPEHWQQVKKSLEEIIEFNEEDNRIHRQLIELVDAKVKENMDKLIKRN